MLAILDYKAGNQTSVRRALDHLGIENLRFYAGIYGVPLLHRAKRVKEVLAETGLLARKDQLSGTLSGGWKQRVALACATIHQPPLLFLDEPTAGVDPVSRRDFWQRIHEIAAGGTTVLLTTHYMDEAERCHRLAFIFHGELLDHGTPEQIVERRGLRVVELEVDRAHDAAERLRAHPDVEEVAHFGHVLRLAARSSADPEAIVRDELASFAVERVRPARACRSKYRYVRLIATSGSTAT